MARTEGVCVASGAQAVTAKDTLFPAKRSGSGTAMRSRAWFAPAAKAPRKSSSRAFPTISAPMASRAAWKACGISKLTTRRPAASDSTGPFALRLM